MATRLTKTAIPGLLAILLLVAGAAAAQQTGRVFSPTGSVDLLRRPTENSLVIRSLPNDTEVTIIDSYREQTWYHVRLADNRTGWIQAEYLVLSESPAPPTSSLSPHEEAMHLVTVANLRAAEMQYDEAMQLYTQAIDLDPSNDAAYIGRGQIYLEQGDTRSAIDDYSTAIMLHPTNDVAYAARALAYVSLGQYEQALSDYDRAIELYPDDYQTRVFRGSVYVALGEYTKAVAEFSEAITLDPTNSQAYYYRGVSNFNRLNFAGALSDFNMVVDMSPTNPDVYAWRGFTYIELGGSDAQIRENFCQHQRLAGDSVIPEVADQIRQRGWQCSSSL